MQPEISRYEARGLRFILITGDSKETINTVLQKNDLHIMVLSDPGNKVAASNGIQAWPTGLIFDRSGRLVHKTIGWDGNSSLQIWQAKVEEVLLD